MALRNSWQAWAGADFSNTSSREPNSNSENDIMQPDNGESTLKGEVPTNHCIIALDDFPIINPSQRSTDMERMVWSLRHVGEYDDNGELPDWLNKTEHSDLKSFLKESGDIRQFIENVEKALQTDPDHEDLTELAKKDWIILHRILDQYKHPNPL
ncbi:hypothetical protein MJO29_016810 [Puccinia striiformis f. sp. tritici]|nr:hypothetical protein MJO29_016810 [Puccinia striiformis f. sp. tritici]